VRRWPRERRTVKPAIAGADPPVMRMRALRLASRLLARTAPGWLAVTCLALATATTAEPDACRECSYQGELAALFLPAAALGPGWELVHEVPVDAASDPELRGSGVRAVRALHYTRGFRGGAEVCSVEIWSFTSPAAARRTGSGLERRAWQIGVQGNLIVMLHGVRLERGQGFRPGLLPACRRLADLTEAHAAALLRAGGPPPAPR
jgi:hypothetical protein